MHITPLTLSIQAKSAVQINGEAGRNVMDGLEVLGVLAEYSNGGTHGGSSFVRHGSAMIPAFHSLSLVSSTLRNSTSAPSAWSAIFPALAVLLVP